MAENPSFEGAAASPLQEAWIQCRELYEDAAHGVQLVFVILKLRYNTVLPKPERRSI